jgi:hypothetical protein
MAADSLSLISGRGVVIYQGKTDKSFIKSRSTTSIARGGGGARVLAAVHTVEKTKTRRKKRKRSAEEELAAAAAAHTASFSQDTTFLLYISKNKVRSEESVLFLFLHFVNIHPEHTHTRKAVQIL